MIINQKFHPVFGGLSNSDNCFVKRFVNGLSQNFSELTRSGVFGCANGEKKLSKVIKEFRASIYHKRSS